MDSILTGIEPWHWWALGAILLGVEILSTTTYLLWPGIAALLVGALNFLMPSLDPRWSVFLFAVVSVVATVVWKRSPWGNADRATHSTLNERSAQYAGRRVVAMDDFDGSTGAVLVDDTRWNAVTVDGSAPHKGDHVIVVGADGALLKVKAA
ncbi:MAG: NfeD family protein [Proteobacteria bacterium]|nr:NfeD family protein [Pseudomonadota bacterium]